MMDATVPASADPHSKPQASGHPARKKLNRYAIRNVRLTYLSYLIDGLVLALYVAMRGGDYLAVALYVTLGISISVAYEIVARLGWTADLRDQHATLPLGWMHLGVQLLGIILMPELSFVFLLVMFIVITSLSMRVPLKQLSLAWLANCVGILWIAADRGLTVTIPADTPAEQALALAFTMAVLWQCLLLGSYNGWITGVLRHRRAELRSLTTQFENLAHHDELTGLLNRRSLMRLLEEELQRANRNRSPLTVAMLDIDHFKGINDKLGHSVGDAVLREFAIAMKEHTRRSDHLGRYGGEEFLMIFTNASLPDAEAPIERLKMALSVRQWEGVPAERQITFSCGITMLQRGDSVEAFLRRADEALYQAKRDGRNCTRSS